MQVITETELLERIAAFRERHEMAPTTFGRHATGNANLVKELEEGKSPSLRTTKRIVDFMDRVDAEAATRAKLDAPLPAPDEQEVEQPLPFGPAPVNRTGASSPISSPTNARPTSPAGRESCRCSTTASPSSSAAEEEESLVAAPTNQPRAA